MRVCIVGSGGFIGAELWQVFKANPLCDTYYVSRESIEGEAHRNLSPEHIAEYEIDVLIYLADDAKSLKEGEVQHVESNFRRLDFYLRSIKNDALFCYVSSRLVYDDVAFGKEDLSLIDKVYKNNPYGEYKRNAEFRVISEATAQRFNYLILRPTNVYGKNAKAQVGNSLVDHVFNCIQVERDVVCVGDGTACRDYVSVQFAANSIHDLIFARQKNQIFNITEGFNCSLNSIVSVFELIFRKKASVEYRSRNRKLNDFSASFEKLKGVLNISYTPEHAEARFKNAFALSSVGP